MKDRFYMRDNISIYKDRIYLSWCKHKSIYIVLLCMILCIITLGLFQKPPISEGESRNEKARSYSSYGTSQTDKGGQSKAFSSYEEEKKENEPKGKLIGDISKALRPYPLRNGFTPLSELSTVQKKEERNNGIAEAIGKDGVKGIGNPEGENVLGTSRKNKTAMESTKPKENIIALQGSIIGAESQAILVVNGKSVVLSIGEQYEQYRVEEIETNRVRVSHGGITVWLYQ